jgi:hypothetical protein
MNTISEGNKFDYRRGATISEEDPMCWNEGKADISAAGLTPAGKLSFANRQRDLGSAW